MRWILKQLALNATKMLAGFAGIFLLLMCGCEALKVRYNHAADSPAYAEAVFERLLPFDRVLASRAYHLIDDDWPNWDCTFAIVELAADAPEAPPSRVMAEDGLNLGWRYVFGGSWEATPKTPLSPNTRDALGFCVQYFEAEVSQRLRSAMREPGSWYVLGPVGETLFIYSLPQRIAARIRFGD
ncbi:hypothetical protein [Thalassobius sp. Cn5-15]|uniref:hypothetical protein n=1 Tax=Thalassobius sp. Cn5-15 TaxID=2917763 RepID=UPI001EF27029|nr:hypothetical protein [Thalassobius sp. Cn5-15]MCG7494825.1 hypothetical protein [Thalassobius sp. Cn5-15]